eukprot:4190780-Pyramimonas_sp.AAC.1
MARLARETLVLQRLKGMGAPGCRGGSGSAVRASCIRDRGPGGVTTRGFITPLSDTSMRTH